MGFFDFSPKNPNAANFDCVPVVADVILRFLEELLGDLSARDRAAWVGVVSSNPNAGQPEPLERDCLELAGLGVGFA
jgi:hypothetical protein